MPTFIRAVGISNEDLSALPVRELDSAIAFYTKVLGCAVIWSDDKAATLARDSVRLAVVLDATHEPGRAGSLAIQVDDLDAMHRELEAIGAEPGAFGTDEWNGRLHRTFFLREQSNGYCYCFYVDM